MLVLKSLTGFTPDITIQASARIATIGRDAEVVIMHPWISRKHAMVTHWRGTWYIRDIGSKNGTRVNRKEVLEPSKLRVGDKVDLGGLLHVVTEAE